MQDYLADSLGFLAFPGSPPEIDPGLKINLIHVTTAPPWIATLEKTLDAHCRFAVSVRDSKRFRVVESPNDVVLGSSTPRIIFGLQHTPEDWDANKKDGLKELREYGIRVISPAYDKVNRFGGGFEAPKAKLTPDGEKLIRFCCAHGLIIDLSHTGEQTVRDIFEFCRKEKIRPRFMASHTGCREVYDHPRNLPNDILLEITERGGVVGIPTLTFILHEKRNDVEPFFEHLRYALRHFGENNVCIGSDATYETLDTSVWQVATENLARQLNKGRNFGVRWPDHPLELNRPDRMAVIAEKLRSFLTERQVQKVIGLNLASFFNRSL